MARITVVQAFAWLSQVAALNNGFATPAMGWNPWNYYGIRDDGSKRFSLGAHGFNETVVRQTADAIVRNGLAAAGYEFVNLDCGWTTGRRDATTGLQIVNSTKFPSGMKALGDYIHSKGLKFGIYSSASVRQCCKILDSETNDGSYGSEEKDAKAYVEFGVDYLKYDGCRPIQSSFPAMRDALNASGRHILLSVNGLRQPFQAKGNFANSWRTVGDVGGNTAVAMWQSVVSHAFANNEHAQFAGPGHFNDPDMLEVGNLVRLGDVTGARSHFSLWCAMKSPLLIGTNVPDLAPEALSILANRHAIAVNQDPLGLQAFVVWSSNNKALSNQTVWAGPLVNGGFTALLLNIGKQPTMINLTRKMLQKSMAYAAPGTVGAPAARFTMFDIWKQKDIGIFENQYSATIQPREVLFLKLSPNTELTTMV